MARLSLNVEAAERYLVSIPLFMEEPLLGRTAPTWHSLELQAADSVCSLAEAHDEAASVEIAGLSCLDVRKAEHFLRSIELDAGEGADARGNAHDGSRPSASTRAAAAHAPERGGWLTVVGGWRSRADLDMLAPGLLRKGLLGGRVIMTTRQSFSYACSTCPPQLDAGVHGSAGVPSAGTPRVLPRGDTRQPHLASLGWCCLRRRSKDQKLVAGTSYAHFLVPSDGRLPRGRGHYDPGFLDDQRLRQGKHHTVLRLEGYQVSVIPFVRPRRLKEELNDQFRSAHPHIHPSITLSKLRNLQKDMREIAATVDELDISTVATAWVYFEKLVLGDFVRKANRKLLAGASLILAFKFNQPSWGSRDKETSEAALLKKLADRIRKLDRKDQLDQAALRNAEVRVFVWLEFSLHLQRAEVLPHLHRMLKDNGETLEHYYGAETTRIVNDEWRLLSGLDDTDGGERGARKPWHKSPLQSPLLGAWLPPARVPERIHLEPHPPRDRLASG